LQESILMTEPPASAAGDPPACRAAAAWAPAPLGLVEATGDDAVRFVDNFTTAAVSRIAVGGGSEAFFTDARGQVLVLTTILRTETGLLIVTPQVLAGTLRDHLEHYHIREAVDLRDASAECTAFLVVGPEAIATMERLSGSAPPVESLAHMPAVIGDAPIRIVRVTGQAADGFWILAPANDAARVAERLAAAAIPRADQAELEALRIEARYPAAADIPAKTLPQELGRDARAISFTKGCYLGQETVARLDALGHVNRRLVRVAIDSPEPPPVPAAVQAGGVEVGTLTSVCPAPLTCGSLGLGLVQVKALAAGGLQVGGAAARAVEDQPSSERGMS
jgi:folate-binding protein YgfZ